LAEPSLSYWKRTQLPFPCIAFVVPMLVVYETGVSILGGASSDALRTGADAWMRQALASLGLRDHLFPPLALVGALLTWQVCQGGDWRFRARDLLSMAVESLVFGIVLIGLSRLVDLGFDRLDGRSILEVRAAGVSRPTAAVIGYLGAGVYEEALFRLALIPLLYYAARWLHAPEVLAGTLAVTGSALLFSLAHHAGIPGEPFTAYAFIFRWLAGIFFAWVFIVRGFGIAVGTHAAYDVLVGSVGLHF
jgi:membrane protease YdiL (CAAX protease family)